MRKAKFKPTDTPKPGPWSLHPHRRALIVDADGVIIAEALHAAGYAEPARHDIKKTIHHFTHPGEIYKGANIAMANAELIARAPELAIALTKARALLTRCVDRMITGEVLRTEIENFLKP